MEAWSPGDRGVAFMEVCRYQGLAFTNTCMGSLPSCRRSFPHRHGDLERMKAYSRPMGSAHPSRRSPCPWLGCLDRMEA